VDGIELLPPARVRAMTVMQKPDHPENEDYPKDWGLGYKLGLPGSMYGPRGFGHGGYGGSDGFADLETGLAVGFTKNLYKTGETWPAIMKELREAIGS
jgi:CubicO group peptidase (beta-lactamase class C family)